MPKYAVYLCSGGKFLDGTQTRNLEAAIKECDGVSGPAIVGQEYKGPGSWKPGELVVKIRQVHHNRHHDDFRCHAECYKQ